MLVEVLALESLPEVGDDFQVVTDTAKAQADREVPRFERPRSWCSPRGSRLTLEELHQQMKEGEVKELPIIIKTDVGGSAQALTETLQKLSNDKAKVRGPRRVCSGHIPRRGVGDPLRVRAGREPPGPRPPGWKCERAVESARIAD